MAIYQSLAIIFNRLVMKVKINLRLFMKTLIFKFVFSAQVLYGHKSTNHSIWKGEDQHSFDAILMEKKR